jgi:hypothetical protein
MSFSNLHAPPITAAFWDAVVARVDTLTLQALHRGAGRVLLEGTYTEPPANDDQLWGRTVIVPVQTLWPVAWLPGSPTSIAFLVRSDWNPLRQAGYNPAIEMEAAQRATFEQLQHWSAGVLDGCQVAFPVYLHRAWQQRPLYDRETNTLYLSAEYRCQLASA